MVVWCAMVVWCDVKSFGVMSDGMMCDVKTCKCGVESSSVM